MAPSQRQALVPAPCRVILNTGEWLQGTAGWVMGMGAHTGLCQVNLSGFPLQTFFNIYIYIYICIYLCTDSPSRKGSRSLTLCYPSPFDHCGSLGTSDWQNWSHLCGSLRHTGRTCVSLTIWGLTAFVPFTTCKQTATTSNQSWSPEIEKHLQLRMGKIMENSLWSKLPKSWKRVFG